MTDHKINKVLANVAGVKVAWVEETNAWDAHWQVEHQGELFEEWTPLTDHNQMASVKAGLRKQGYGYDIAWAAHAEQYEVAIYTPSMKWLTPLTDPDDIETFEATHPTDELRAIAEAVAKMKA